MSSIRGSCDSGPQGDQWSSNGSVSGRRLPGPYEGRQHGLRRYSEPELGRPESPSSIGPVDGMPEFLDQMRRLPVATPPPPPPYEYSTRDPGPPSYHRGSPLSNTTSGRQPGRHSSLRIEGGSHRDSQSHSYSDVKPGSTNTVGESSRHAEERVSSDSGVNARPRQNHAGLDPAHRHGAPVDGAMHIMPANTDGQINPQTQTRRSRAALQLHRLFRVPVSVRGEHYAERGGNPQNSASSPSRAGHVAQRVAHLHVTSGAERGSPAEEPTASRNHGNRSLRQRGPRLLPRASAPNFRSRCNIQ